jgi:hypothetical protein
MLGRFYLAIGTDALDMRLWKAAQLVASRRAMSLIGHFSNGQRPELGLSGKDQALLAVTLLLGVITLGTGRTTVLQGVVDWSSSPPVCSLR